MYMIMAYNKKKIEYDILDSVRATNAEDALELWKEENPKRMKVIEENPEIKLVALLEAGGI